MVMRNSFTLTRLPIIIALINKTLDQNIRKISKCHTPLQQSLLVFDGVPLNLPRLP